jgi:hypothetical protein
MTISDHKLADIHIKIEQLRIDLSELRKELQECDKPAPAPRRSPTGEELVEVYKAKAERSEPGMVRVQHHILTELRKELKRRTVHPAAASFEILDQWLKENE